MTTLIHLLDSLEHACASEESLLRFSKPDMGSVLAELRTLPDTERREVLERLDHVKHVMETNMAIYAVEKERLSQKLGVNVAQVALPVAALPEGVAAIIPVASVA